MHGVRSVVKVSKGMCLFELLTVDTNNALGLFEGIVSAKFCKYWLLQYNYLTVHGELCCLNGHLVPQVNVNL